MPIPERGGVTAARTDHMAMDMLGMELPASAGLALAATAGAVAGWLLRRGAPSPAPPSAVSAAPAAMSPVAEPDRPFRHVLAGATDVADELISIVRPDGTIAHANSACCRALGYDLATLSTLKSVDVLADQSRASVREIESTVRGEGIWRGTLVRRRQDGGTFITSGSVLAVTDPGGAITHFVAVERDITQESQLREQLIHSERLAAVGQLVSGVAHELNNPLQAVIGFTELLIDTERRKESRADLEQVRREAHRAAKIVRNLLAFVRRSAVERAPLAVNDLVRATVALRKYELSMSGVTLTEAYGDDLPLVMANREEIQQVVLNLVLNAEQAMKTSGQGGRLLLRTAAGPEGVTIEVEDSGPGVPPNVARQIFEPFFSTKGVGEGTGLGLSIALGIAQAHGGTLSLNEPIAGRGACFRLRLPAAVGVDGQAVAPAAVVATAWNAVSGRRALVADEDEALRKLLHRLLTRRGFAVDLAEDGAQAASLIEINRYDMILCNSEMPKLAGVQLYEHLRRRHPHLAAAFVLISGDALSAPLQAFVDASQLPLLSKPFGARTLDVVLEQVLANRMKSGDLHHSPAA